MSLSYYCDRDDGRHLAFFRTCEIDQKSFDQWYFLPIGQIKANDKRMINRSKTTS